jgi:hypothetical protein
MSNDNDIHPKAPASNPGPGGFQSPQPAGLNAAMDKFASPQPLGTAAAAAPALEAPTPDPEIEALSLSPVAKAAAYALKKAHPAVSFTSGRRDKQAQAHAMASNVTSNRKWIQETYADNAASRACQKWVDDNPTKTTQDEITIGLKSVMDSLTDEALGKLSKHLSGEAFDVQPVTTDADAIKKTIRGLTGITLFLEKEGGLVRWHAQF